MTEKTTIPTRPRRNCYRLSHRHGIGHPFGRLEQETARLFDALLPGTFREVFRVQPDATAGQSRFIPGIEIREGKDAVRISVELAGVAPEDVEVQFEKDHLVIRGEKKSGDVGDDENVYRERSFGSFERVIPVNAGIDEANIKATFSNGVLDVNLPKKDPETGVTKIKVEAAKK